MRRRGVSYDVIEALPFEGSSADLHDVYLWVEEHAGSFEPMSVVEKRVRCPDRGVSIDPRDGRMMLATARGLQHVDIGDWVVKNATGSFYPVKPDVFHLKYEEVFDGNSSAA